MKKKNRVYSYLSNNPTLDGVEGVDLPVIGAEAYDAPLPYTRTEPHSRAGKGDRTIRYPVTKRGDEYPDEPIIFDGES